MAELLEFGVKSIKHSTAAALAPQLERSCAVFAPEVHAAEVPPDVFGQGTVVFKQQSPLPEGFPRITQVQLLHLESASHAAWHVLAGVPTG